MRPPPSNQALTAALNRLLREEKLARIDLAKRMGVADGTLGRIKYGKANPTLDVVDQIASYYRIPAWRLIQPENERVGEERAEYSQVMRNIIDRVAKLSEDRQRALLRLLEPDATPAGSGRAIADQTA